MLGEGAAVKALEAEEEPDGKNSSGICSWPPNLVAAVDHRTYLYHVKKKDFEASLYTGDCCLDWRFVLFRAMRSISGLP